MSKHEKQKYMNACKLIRKSDVKQQTEWSHNLKNTCWFRVTCYTNFPFTLIPQHENRASPRTLEWKESRTLFDSLHWRKFSIHWDTKRTDKKTNWIISSDIFLCDKRFIHFLWKTLCLCVLVCIFAQTYDLLFMALEPFKCHLFGYAKRSEKNMKRHIV